MPHLMVLNECRIIMRSPILKLNYTFQYNYFKEAPLALESIAQQIIALN